MTRPDWIVHNGWRESVLCHDRAYVARKHQFKRELASTHPDRKRFTVPVTSDEVVSKKPFNYDRCKCGNWKARTSAICYACIRVKRTPLSFFAVQAKYKAWLIQETKWYAERGLLPPGGRRSSGVASTAQLNAPKDMESLA